MKNVAHETEKAISGAIKIDEKEIQDNIDGLVRQSVEDTLNALLNAEADAICNASCYQRTPDRLDILAAPQNRPAPSAFAQTSARQAGALWPVGLFGSAQSTRETLIRQNQMCAKLRTLPNGQIPFADK